MQSTTALLPREKQLVAFNSRRLVRVTNCISAMGDYIIGDVWQRDREAYGGMRLVRERSFYGGDAPQEAREWANEQINKPVRLRKGKMPLYWSFHLGWVKLPGRIGEPTITRA